MDKDTKEKLYIKLNNLLDILHEGEAKEYVRNLINEIYYDQLQEIYVFIAGIKFNQNIYHRL